MEELNTFDTVIIFTDELDDGAFDDVTIHYKQILKSLSAIRIKTEKMGKRKLAYELKGHKEGLYLMFRYQAPNDAIDRLERLLRIDDNALKFITVKLDSDEEDYEPDEDEIQSEQPKEEIKKPVDVFDLIYGIE